MTADTEFLWLDSHGQEQGRRPNEVYCIQWRYRSAETKRRKSSFWLAQRLADAKRCANNITKWGPAQEDDLLAVFKGTISWEEIPQEEQA